MSVSPQPWTVRWLIDTFLYGINLTEDRNRPFPDVLFTQAMALGKQWLVDSLDIVVDRQEFTERHDLNRNNNGEWHMTKLNRCPINRIKSVKLKIGTTPDAIALPNSWIQDYDKDGGLFWLVPSSHEIISLTAMQYSLMTARNWMQYGNLPGFIEVTYDAGYDVPFEVIADPTIGWWAPVATAGVCGRLNIRIGEQVQTGYGASPSRTFTITGTDIATGLTATETLTVSSNSSAWTVKGWSAISSVTWTECDGDILFSGNFRDQTNHSIYRPIDPALLDLGGKVASMYVLNPAGDLIAGAGIASFSASMGGVSQSVSTTSSATNSGYGARIIQYRQDVGKDLPNVRRRFHGAMNILAV